jgi:hypothetical protein
MSDKATIPFEPCSSINVCGPTGSGKSFWVFRFLRNIRGMYVDDPPIKVMYCYGVYQPLFDEIEKTVPGTILHAGLPTQKEIEEFADGEHGLIILDDLQHQVLESRDIELLFTQGCHHRRLSVIFITQNLYGQGKSARTIALNCWYLVLFKNIRGTSQIQMLGQQLFPGRSKTLVESFGDATKKCWGYLVLDLSPRAEDEYRLRTNIYPDEDTVIYKSL